MSESRICPECGSDIYRAAGYDDLREARDRHWQKNREQAIEILKLQLKVAELEEWRRTRNGKIERQRRSIKRLEEKVRSFGAWPHDDKGSGEADPGSPAPAISSAPPSPPPEPSRRGLLKLKQNRERIQAGEEQP